MKQARLAFRLALPAAYRAADFLAFHRRDAAALAERVDGNAVQKGMVWAGRPACIGVRFGARHAAVELVVDGVDSVADADAARRMARRMLGLQQAVDDFEAPYRGHPELGPLIAANPGLRVPLLATPFEAIVWAVSTDIEQMLMMLVALDNLGGRVGKGKSYGLQDLEAVFSQRDRELRDLEERAVLRRLPFSDAHGFVSSAMEWWVIKEIENARDESELGLREKVLVGLSRKQVQQVTGALKQVWANKDAIAQVASWLGKLVGAFAKGTVKGAVAV